MRRAEVLSEVFGCAGARVSTRRAVLTPPIVHSTSAHAWLSSIPADWSPRAYTNNLKMHKAGWGASFHQCKKEQAFAKIREARFEQCNEF